ncbi:MAG: 1-deoxy-D-xylulose-5-phosphate synthase [Lachnospiraceae bacterium]|nr:1-deoxy-D-xylulose-5-phosphate synthase [Lachnospiraceae bacterium]
MLERINKANDIHLLEGEDLNTLAEEIRSFLIDKVSRTGGHLASNLGVVELTIALHKVLSFPEDKLIWDVGHQAYTHKILTGRKEGFDSLRQLDGMSGFPKRSESDCDAFDTGHSTTSISAGLGYVKARDLQRQRHKVFAVIGDGSLTGGMGFEALNNAATLKTNYVVVLNDNSMSISRNVGGMAQYLGRIRTAASYTGLKMGVSNMLNHIPKVGEKMVSGLRKTKSSIKQLVIPGMLFENLGITYLGPVDGHDIPMMIRVFEEAARVEGPVIVHVITKKGKGYEPAEKKPDLFHGIGTFDPDSGEIISSGREDYTHVFSEALCQLAAKNGRITAITAAMPQGTGLKKFAALYPKRFIDVGIAEEHAVTFAAGLAAGGLVPVVAVYSSFMQRAFDQMLMDACMQNLHIVFALDRAGLVGNDGETHQGAFDLSFLALMPNMTVMAPMDKADLEDMLAFAIDAEGPVALRYPRGEAYRLESVATHASSHENEPAQGTTVFACPPDRSADSPITLGKGRILRKGSGTAIISVGSMGSEALKAADILAEQGKNVTVADMRFVKPMDEDLLLKLTDDHDRFLIVEDNVAAGGFGERAVCVLNRCGRKLTIDQVTLPDAFVPHGSVAQLRKALGMDGESLARRLQEDMSE